MKRHEQFFAQVILHLPEEDLIAKMDWDLHFGMNNLSLFHLICRVVPVMFSNPSLLPADYSLTLCFWKYGPLRCEYLFSPVPQNPQNATKASDRLMYVSLSYNCLREKQML